MESALIPPNVHCTALGIKFLNAVLATLDIPSSMESAQPINTADLMDS